MNIKELHPNRFRIEPGRGRARVIGLVPHEILTRTLYRKVKISQGRLHLSPGEDLSLLACVERHRGTGNIGLGLVSGFGPLRGALASSVAHDSHNILVVGHTPEEVYLAVRTLETSKGGLVVTGGGRVLAHLPLPIGGLMCDEPAEQVIAHQKALHRAAREIGCRLRDPFMALSFLALPVIPELKLTDRGLVDVARFDVVPLFA